MTLFNEANIGNILETILYGESACQALGDSVIDLIDYTVRHLTILASEQPLHETGRQSLKSGLDGWKPGDEIPDIPVESVEDELERLRKDVAFQIAMKSLSILRYLTDHIDELTLSAANRMTITHDLPILMAQLLEIKPWMKFEKDSSKIFDGSDWIEDEGQLGKLEGQAWITLYNLMSKKAFQEKYEMHHYRITVLSKLSGQLNDHIISQLPVLEKLKEWLLRINLAKPSAPPPKNMVLIEAVAAIKDSLESRYASKYQDIANEQKDLFLQEASEAWQAEAGRLIDTLETEAAQQLLTSKGNTSNQDANKKACGHCRRAEAGQRCSRCQAVRYCSRECQALDWPRHRGRCKIAAEQQQEEKIKEL